MLELYIDRLIDFVFGVPQNLEFKTRTYLKVLSGDFSFLITIPIHKVLNHGDQEPRVRTRRPGE
jgi:hypothetical protein